MNGNETYRFTDVANEQSWTQATVPPVARVRA